MKPGLKNHRKDADMDPFSTSIVEDLLQGTADWEQIDDIVKLALKALTEVVRVQSESIRELKTSLTTRASKSQLSTGLSLKSNTSDVSRTVAELGNVLESKVSLNEFNTVMRDYVTRSDIQQILATKVSAEDFRQIALKQPSQRPQRAEQSSRIDEVQKAVDRKLAGLVTLGEFKELLSIIDQKANTSELNDVLETKVSKQALASSLQKKIARSEMDLCLAKKADMSDLEYIVNNLETKVDLSTIEKLSQVIENKCDRSDVNAVMNSLGDKCDKAELELVVQAIEQVKSGLEKQISQLECRLQDSESTQQLRKSLSSLKQSVSHLVSQPPPKPPASDLLPTLNSLKYELLEDISKVKEWAKVLNDESTRRAKELYEQHNQLVKELAGDSAGWRRREEKIYKEIDDVRRRAEEVAARGLHNNDFIEFKSQVVAALEEKLEASEVKQALDKLQDTFIAKIAQDKQETVSLINSVEKSLSNCIAETSSELVRITAVVSKKQDRQEYSLGEQSSKKNARKEIQQFRRTVDKILSETQNKLNLSEYQNDLLQIKKRFEAFQKQISNKANIKDVCILADSKPNIEEVNKALKQIHDQLDSKVSDEELKTVVQDQASINETLCSENIVGRWLWHSGQTKAGSLVPWQSESVNTLADNFLWDKDKTSILTMASGMYELVLCFFCRSKPIVTLIVNGENITTKGSIPQEGVVKKRKQKDMLGVKLTEYIMLPARARVSVAFSGDHGAEGFLNIRRL